MSIKRIRLYISILLSSSLFFTIEVKYKANILSKTNKINKYATPYLI